MTFVKPSFTPESLPPQPLPTMYDLPSENPEEPGLPDEFHGWQAQLLSQTFQPSTYALDRVFAASDLNVLCGSPYPQRSGVGKDSTPSANPDSQCTASGHQWGSIAGRHVEELEQH